MFRDLSIRRIEMDDLAVVRRLAPTKAVLPPWRHQRDPLLLASLQDSAGTNFPRSTRPQTSGEAAVKQVRSSVNVGAGCQAAFGTAMYAKRSCEKRVISSGESRPTLMAGRSSFPVSCACYFRPIGARRSRSLIRFAEAVDPAPASSDSVAGARRLRSKRAKDNRKDWRQASVEIGLARNKISSPRLRAIRRPGTAIRGPERQQRFHRPSSLGAWRSRNRRAAARNATPASRRQRRLVVVFGQLSWGGCNQRTAEHAFDLGRGGTAAGPQQHSVVQNIPTRVDSGTRTAGPQPPSTLRIYHRARFRCTAPPFVGRDPWL